MAEQPAPITITENAAKRLQSLIAQEGKDDLTFRISVSGGGCSGFQYNFEFIDEAAPDDIVSEQRGVNVAVDSMALLYLLGSELDFVEDLIGASFQVKNPNAASSCGCGTSFAI